MTEYKVLKAQTLEDGRSVVTVRHNPSEISRLLGAKTRDVQYVKHQSGWVEMPDYRMCSNEMEGIISDYLEQSARQN